jgi:hypothetical protein
MEEKGLMRTRTGWLVCVLTAGIALAPAPGRGQDVPPADHPILPLPLYHDRPEKGGFYAAGEFLYWRQTNPIKQQTIAVRGFDDVDGSLQAARNVLQPFLTDPLTGITLTRPGINPNTGAAIQVPIPSPTPVPGAFFGSGTTALDASDLAGPNSYSAGFGLTLGWRFCDGFTLEFNWRHLQEVRYNAVASIIPRSFDFGRNSEDQFLFSPVYNFPPEFAGPVFKIQILDLRNPMGPVSGTLSVIPNPVSTVGGTRIITGFQQVATASSNGGLSLPQAAYGIWNAATVMGIDFVQRTDMYDLIGRIPLYENECSRWYGLLGFRHVALWERFKWRTEAVEAQSAQNSVTVPLLALQNAGLQITTNNFIVSTVVTPPATAGGQQFQNSQVFNFGIQTPPPGVPAVAGADDVAIYTNIVSNRMYGPTIGCGSEWYLGWGFSCSLDLRAALHVDVVKERARYEREDRYIASKRSRTEYVFVPELDALANVCWYPFEGIEVRVGYDFMNFFNTIASPQPVDFNYGATAPAWDKGQYRFIEGFHAGIGFIF